jgi:MFS family permease
MARVGLVLLAAGLTLFPFAHGYALLLFAMTLMPLGTAFTFPAVTALLSRVVPSRERGTYMGVQQTVGGVSRVVFPWWDGWAFDHIGMAAPFVVCGVLTAGTLSLIRGMTVPAVPSRPAEEEQRSGGAGGAQLPAQARPLATPATDAVGSAAGSA